MGEIAILQKGIDELKQTHETVKNIIGYLKDLEAYSHNIHKGIGTISESVQNVMDLTTNVDLLTV